MRIKPLPLAVLIFAAVGTIAATVNALVDFTPSEKTSKPEVVQEAPAQVTVTPKTALEAANVATTKASEAHRPVQPAPVQITPQPSSDPSQERGMQFLLNQGGK